MDSSVHFSSKSNQHYTPYNFLARVCEFYGGSIDLDPCSNSLSNPHCPASMHYTIELDGLALPWFGRVFVNPPYGREGLPAFVDKFIGEQSNYTDALLLVPARTDTKWHQRLAGIQRCYLHGRLKFHNPANKGNSAPFPSALFYIGKRDFCGYWSQYGEVFPVQKALSKSRKEYMREYMRKRRAKQQKTLQGEGNPSGG